LYTKVPPNGLVVYCGEIITSEGKERKINIDFEPFKPINTSVDGLQISEHLPLLAKQMNNLVVVRSMSTREADHNRGRYYMHTGYVPNPTIEHPSYGAVVAHELADKMPNLEIRFMDKKHNSTGLQLVPDNDPNANPRGLAVRFNLAEHVHTDIVSHSTDGFPTRTGEEFLEFLRALASSDLSNIPASPLGAFLGSHPAALAFVQAPKPAPSSYGRETYFGVTAMQFTNAEGVSRFGRYRIVPEAGNDHLDDDATKAKGADYLIDEIADIIFGPHVCPDEFGLSSESP